MTEGQLLAVADALGDDRALSLLTRDECVRAARTSLRALDQLAAAPPRVNPAEAARRLSLAVREIVKPYDDLLAGLDQTLEPPIEHCNAQVAISNVQRALYALESAMRAASPHLTRLDLTLPAEDR